MNEICTVCQRVRDGVLPQWWSLTQYHGVNGIYCPACFEKVRHKDGKPVHPIAYGNLLRKMDGSAPTQAHSKSQYKRLSAQGAKVSLPTPTTLMEAARNERTK
tara:strand:- start:39 stop:347 length:309 start_codon:yes stop_codon:yes gene_type:complete